MNSFGSNFSTGTHLISTATVFGASALAFAMLPFAIVLLRAIAKAKENTTNGFSVVGAVLLAFGTHFVFCVLFVAIIKILDITYVEEANFYTQKIYKIFWATDRNAVFSLVGASATNDALGAYSTLLLVQTIGRMVLYNMPILVTIVGFSYGFYQAYKDNYRQDYLTVLTFSAISFICVWVMYVAWAYVASEALFLPGGKNLFDMTSQYWQQQLK